MPIGYDYHCDACEYDWMLFSTRLALGPTQWEHVRYTCFTCQTFLTVANSVDRSSWAIWVRNNRQSLDKNPALAQLVNLVDQQLSSVHGFTPIQLKLGTILCPECKDDQMRDIAFGDHPMRCPRCHKYTGHFVNDHGISIYTEAEPDEQIDK